ncbi:MAG TPA: hypothetical protein ENN86_00620 [Desulfobacteraceae bacterium]|nr:hypothetical protein [Desulfobacteraceae bacterium]
MTEKRKKGIFSMLFGNKESGCCNMKIEEVTEEEEGTHGEESDAQPVSFCCGTRSEDGKHVKE